MRPKRRRLVRRFAQAGLVLLLLPVGIAHMAMNSVPVTYAGKAMSEVAIPTSLGLDEATVVVSPEGTYQFTDMKARLSSAGEPVAGATLLFQVAGETVCAGATGQSGQAVCSSDEHFAPTDFRPVGADPQALPFAVAFLGTGALEGSAATGRITAVEAGNPASP